jgi:hypothetical protein
VWIIVAEDGTRAHVLSLCAAQHRHVDALRMRSAHGPSRLEGTLTLRLGDRTIDAGPGSFVCVPPGVVHTFRNDGDRPVRFLNFNTPAGWENYMRDRATAAQSAPLTPQVIARVASRYDFEFAG